MLAWGCLFALQILCLQLVSTASIILPLHDLITNISKPSFLHETIPPQDFRVIPRDYGQELRSTACFANSINVLGEIGQGEFEGEIQKPTLYRYKYYPDVFFGVVPAHGSMKRKFAIWGIWLGVHTMSNENKFREVTLNLEYQGSLVGFIYFKLWRASLSLGSLLNGTQHLQAQLVPSWNDSDAGVSTSSITLGASPLKIEMEFLEISRQINPTKIYMAVLAALLKAVIPSGTEVIREDIQFTTEQLGVAVVFRQPTRPRKRPPFLQYQHAIKTLMAVPEFLGRSNEAGELSFSLEVGVSLVCEGYIIRSDLLEIIKSDAGIKAS